MSNHHSDASLVPLVYKPGKAADSNYHTREWTSGKRGGGKVPADFEWRTNPKQCQEELGANVPEDKP